MKQFHAGRFGEAGRRRDVMNFVCNVRRLREIGDTGYGAVGQARIAAISTTPTLRRTAPTSTSRSRRRTCFAMTPRSSDLVKQRLIAMPMNPMTTIAKRLSIVL
jgi:hypothetical protein